MGYLPGPQSHQLVGEYHGAPSAMQSGSGAVVLATLEVREAFEYDALAEIAVADPELVWPIVLPELVSVMTSDPEAELNVVESLPGGSEKE